MLKSVKISAKEVLELTGRLVDRLGPRILGSASCARAADEIATELGRHCSSVRKERFTARPGAGLLFVAPFFFYFSRRGSPGAGDNLAACAMGIKIAELLGGQQAPRPLQQTRVVVLSTDGEEPGMLGAEAFARVHQEELKELKTYVLDFDTIYKAADLTLVTKDRNATIRLSGTMVADCRRIAADLGYPIKAGPIPTGGGATDAARFAEIGVEAVSILPMSMALIQEDTWFHTPNDTVEHIEPAAVEACLSIAYRYILEKDRAG